MQMNLQLQHVVSDITGATGLRIIRAILSGQHDPVVLAAMRDVRCKQSEATIAKALQGNYRPEHLFALQQSVELYDTYQEKVASCDRQIERLLDELKCAEQPTAPSPQARYCTKQPNAPSFDVRASLYTTLGVDLTQIHGMGPLPGIETGQ